MLLMVLGKLGRSVWWQLLAVLAVILAVKGIFLLLDSTPSFFYGDSEAYLAVAVLKWIPPDRSFLYGLLIRSVALRLHSLEALIYLQTVCSALASWLLCRALAGPLRVRFLLSAAFGILCAVEPLQLMMERYVMTEAISNFLFALHFTLLLVYLKQGRLWTLLVAQAVGCVMIAIRISFLPELFLTSILVPLLSPYAITFYREALGRTRGMKSHLTYAVAWRPAVHLILCLIVSQGILTFYKHWYGSLTHREPALFYENGAFLLSDFAPLVELQDFPKWAHGPAILKRVRIDPKDPRNRPAQHFVEGGLWIAVKAEFPDPKEANKVALRTATRALLRRPEAAARLAFQTFLSYFDPTYIRGLLLDDEGHGGQLDPVWPNWLRTKFGVNDPQSYRLTLTKRWHVDAVCWYWLILSTLLVSPLLLFGASRSNLNLLIVIVAVALVFLEGATLTVDRATPRFLTTDAWMVLLIWGVAAEALISRIRPSQKGMETTPVFASTPVL